MTAGVTCIPVREAAVLAQADPQCSPADRMVLATIAAWQRPRGVSLDAWIADKNLTLDVLATQVRYPRPVVFACVAQLEDIGYLPKSAIR